MSLEEALRRPWPAPSPPSLPLPLSFSLSLFLFRPSLFLDWLNGRNGAIWRKLLGLISSRRECVGRAWCVWEVLADFFTLLVWHLYTTFAEEILVSAWVWARFVAKNDELPHRVLLKWAIKLPPESLPSPRGVYDVCLWVCRWTFVCTYVRTYEDASWLAYLLTCLLTYSSVTRVQGLVSDGPGARHFLTPLRLIKTSWRLFWLPKKMFLDFLAQISTFQPEPVRETAQVHKHGMLNACCL